MEKCSACQTELPSHLLLNVGGRKLCEDCERQQRDTSRFGLHRSVIVALAVATGSIFVCTIEVGGRDWGAVLLGGAAAVFGARGLAEAKQLTAHKQVNLAAAGLAIAIGGWRIVYGLGVLSG